MPEDFQASSSEEEFPEHARVQREYERRLRKFLEESNGNCGSSVFVLVV